jgi:hypothetical protein
VFSRPSRRPLLERDEAMERAEEAALAAWEADHAFHARE